MYGFSITVDFGATVTRVADKPGFSLDTMGRYDHCLDFYHINFSLSRSKKVNMHLQPEDAEWCGSCKKHVLTS